MLIESFCKLKLGISGTISQIYDDKSKGIKKLYRWKGGYINSTDFEDVNLGNTLKYIFNNSYNKSNDALQNSFYLTWGLRNNFHHNIESIQIIRENFKIIIGKQMEFFINFVIKK